MKQLLFEELVFLQHAATRLWDSCEDSKFSFPNGDFLDAQQYANLQDILQYEIDKTYIHYGEHYA